LFEPILNPVGEIDPLACPPKVILGVQVKKTDRYIVLNQFIISGIKKFQRFPKGMSEEDRSPRL